MSKAIAILACTVAVLAASYGALATPAEMTGVETAVFADREVVVIRHTGGVTVSMRCLRDFDARTLTITLSNLRAKEAQYLVVNQPTLTSVELSPVAGKNVVLLKLALTDAEVIERGSFRFGGYSEHVVLVELFSPGVHKEDKTELRNLESRLTGLLEDEAGEAAAETPRELETGKMVLVEADPGREKLLGSGEAERMHSNHLPSLDTRLTIIAEGAGIVSSDQGGRGLRAALDEGAVGEVVFVGSPEEVESVRRFLRTTRFRTTARNL